MIEAKQKESVLNVVNEYIENKKDIPYEVIKEEIKKITEMEDDYKKTISDLLWHNSIIKKFENLIDLMSTISTISIEDEEKLDKALLFLNSFVESIKD